MAILGDSTITDLSVINDMQVNGLFTKPIIIQSSIGGAFNEGIRITKSSNNWAGMVIGCNAGSASGAPSAQGGWYIGNDTSNRLIINNVDSGTANSSIWINTDKTVNIGKAAITTLNGVTVGSSPKFTDTVYTHPTSAGNIHLPSGGASGNFLKWASAGTGKWESLTKSEITTALGYIPPTTDTKYSAGTGISLSGTTINHSNSITAGTAGTSSATSGSTLAVPYVTYDAQGHVTAAGTHTHTVSGFLTSHQTIKQNGVTGAVGNRFGTCSTAAATVAKAVSITSGTPTLEAGLKVTVKFTYANTANSPTLNVNSLGAKNIFHKGAQITSGANKALLAGVCDFIYDGTQFHLVGNYIDTTYSAMTATEATTGTATTARTITAKVLADYITAQINGINAGDVTKMTGYAKPSNTSAITTSDSLNTAIGKLEKALDGKQAAGNYAAATHNHPSSQVNLMTGYAKPSSTSAIAATDSLNTAIGKLEKALDGKQASGNYALKTDIPTVWDSDGHLVSPSGWKLWITDEDT